MNNTTSSDQSSSNSQGSGQNTSDIVSYVALIVSLAAFATTVLQVLQQYLASADGYRRCAPSVIGPWSRGTHRRFRHRELRFEVVFETPVIFVAPPTNTKGPIYKRQIYNLDGTDKSYDETNTLKPDNERQKNISTADDERASWVTLLGALQKSEADSREWEKKLRFSPRGKRYEDPQYTVCYSIQKKTRSYDFMPPAVTKPYATTTISHLVEIIGMLGMHWKAFDVVKGNVRAEGNGYIVTSTLVHGLGVLMNFSVTGASHFTDKRVIPFHDVKELVFGFVPSIFDQNLEFGSLDRVKRTLRSLKCPPEVIALYEAKKDRTHMFSETWKSSSEDARMTSCKQWLKPATEAAQMARFRPFSFLDTLLINITIPPKIPNMRLVAFELIGMLAETFRLRNSVLYMLPNPTEDSWPGDASMIEWWGEMKGYQDCLECLIMCDPTTQTARGPLMELISTHALVKLISQRVAAINRLWTKEEGDIDVREEIHDSLDRINSHLRDPKMFSQKEITRVLNSHLQTILAATDEIQQAMIAFDLEEIDGKLVRSYFDKVLWTVEGLDLTDDEKSKRGVIWLGLIFRMVCWFSLHDFDKNDVNMMPADMKGSRMPVFIG